MITPLDIAVLGALAKYYCLCRPQLQTLCFEHHKDGRALRARLMKLRTGGFAQRTQSLVPYRGGASGTPVWYLTRAGAELLCEWHDDPRYLALNTRAPRPDVLFHWLAIGDTRIAIERAVRVNNEVTLGRWINEWEVLDKEGGIASPRFYLQTVFRGPPNPLSCSPDAGFVIEYADHHVVWYLEQDRNTSGVRQIAASKTKGYAELARTLGHRKHFPETTLDRFGVLLVTTHSGRRSALQRALKNEEGADLWLLACQDDLTAQNFPFGEVFHDCHGVAGPLVRRRGDVGRDD